MLASKLLSAASGTETRYVDDVFSTYLYSGDDSTRTVTTGIDLSGNGGMVWIKSRNSTWSNYLHDTARGGGKELVSDTTNSAGTNNYLTGFTASGFTLSGNVRVNGGGSTYASWTFRKAARFFDCGTYTGDGVAGRQIPHSLGVAPGMVIVKRTDAAGEWLVWHRGNSTPATDLLYLNRTDAVATGSVVWNSTSPTASVFTVSNSAANNASGGTYVYYALAHDTSADGIIQCGSAVVSGGALNVTLNWEPQYVMLKASSAVGNWQVYDTMRGWNNSTASTDEYLLPNSSGAAGTTDAGNPTATGFTVNGLPNGDTYIYLAIRRPNKPPTTGTQVYNAIARTGTGSGAAQITGAGFQPDMVVGMGRSTGTNAWYDRLRGKERALRSHLTNAEYDASPGGEGTFSMDGVQVENTYGILNSAFTYINHFFRRAPGVFDVVCYTGTGSATTVSHSLGVAPELMIVKSRSSNWDWRVYSSSIGATNYLTLNNGTGSAVFSGYWNNTSPSSSSFSLGSGTSVNATSENHVAYLFATKAGISKVGSYTGNGTSQTIDCGFSTGARFFLVKATSTTGSWWIFDSVRGVISAADPALQLNSTAAEITSADAVDPTSVGIVVNQEASCSINATGVNYVFLALS